MEILKDKLQTLCLADRIARTLICSNNSLSEWLMGMAGKVWLMSVAGKVWLMGVAAKV